METLGVPTNNIVKRALAVGVIQNVQPKAFETSQFWLLHRLELCIQGPNFADVYYIEMVSQELCT